MMKRISDAAAAAACLFCLSGLCFGEEAAAGNDAAAPAAAATVQQDENAVSWLEPAAGEWYGLDGKLAMTIQGGTIDNCPVTAEAGNTFGYPRNGRFKMQQGGTVRELALMVVGHKSHQYLIVDNTTLLRRSIHAEYGEAVGGAYLGMTKEDLLKTCGEPTSVAPSDVGEQLGYEDRHMDVFCQWGIVTAIRLHQESELTFAVSGLRAGDSPRAYAQAYHLEEIPSIPAEEGAVSKAYPLPQGEQLHFGKGYVVLSVV